MCKQQFVTTATFSTAGFTLKPPLPAEDASRYKTKLCRSFLSTGVCPYESRCMFAHGAQELRTPEMNMRDGLTSEDAIRAYRKKLREEEEKQKREAATRHAQLQAQFAGSALHRNISSHGKIHPHTPSAHSFAPTPTAQSECMVSSTSEWPAEEEVSPSDSSSDGPSSPLPLHEEIHMLSDKRVRKMWRHDPYAITVL